MTPPEPVLQTALTDVLGVEHPILLAPMGDVAGGRLAAAVTAAGGLGFVGVGYRGADHVAQQLDAAGAARVGVGFITFALDRDPGILTAVLERGVPAVQLSFGDPTPYMDAIHEAGALVICQVQRVEEAERCADAGADVIIAQGQDAGGHGRPGRGTFGLVPAVVDAVDPVPVVAAGGIADGRGIAAALVLGAVGVSLGTRFYASAEAVSTPSATRLLVERGGDDTVRTSVFDVVRRPPWPEGHDGRAIANRMTDGWLGAMETKRSIAEKRAEYRSSASDDYSIRPVWAGEGLDQIESVLDAERIVADIVAGALQALRPFS